MWCCFTANTVSEPTKLKPLAAEVPVATKPVTLMFRLPSDEAEATTEKKDDIVSAPEPEHLLEDAQGEEVPSLSMDRDDYNNPFTILLALAMFAFLYSTMSRSDSSEL
jgi:hypothetical protein